MDYSFLKTAGELAGIGGLALGSIIILFREIIRKSVFPRLTTGHAFWLLCLIVVLSWTVAVAGIGAWVWTVNHPQPLTPKDQLVPNLSGSWILSNVIRKTTFRPYEGLKIGYKVYIVQSGQSFTGAGKKQWENDQEVNSDAHSPISITGAIVGDTVRATFTEKGRTRSTVGELIWYVSQNQSQYVGTFSWTAAEANGDSMLVRESVKESGSRWSNKGSGKGNVPLTLYVHDGSASGPVLSGVRVNGQDAAGTNFDQTTNSNGRVTLVGAPGTWVLSVSKNGYGTNNWNQSITETCTKNAFLIK